MKLIWFDLHENEPVGGTHFHMNGFAQRGKRELGNGLFRMSNAGGVTVFFLGGGVDVLK